MALSIRVDIVREFSYQEDDRSGNMIRCYLVSNLTPGPSIGDAALKASDGTTTIPKAGQFHETLSDLIVRAVRLKAYIGSRTQMYVYVTYVKVRRRLLDIRLGTSIFNTNWEKDRQGKILVVGYKPPTTQGGTSTPPDAQPPYPPTAAADKAGWRYDYGSVQFLETENTLEIDYLESSNCYMQSRDYQHRLNSKAWQGEGPRNWFFEGVIARTESPIPTNIGELGNPTVIDGTGKPRFNWIVTRRFRRIPPPPVGPGWDPLLLYVDRATGLNPTDIDPVGGGWLTGATQGNGWKKVQLYDEADFNDLNLADAMGGP